MLYNNRNILRFHLGDAMLFEEKHSRSNYYCSLEYDNINCLLHCQTSFEIVFVESGFVKLELKDNVLTIKENECVWILPYEIHRITTPENSKVSISIFSTDYLVDFYTQVKGKALNNPLTDYGMKTLETLKNHSSDRFLLKSALYGLCSKVISNGISETDIKTETDNSVKIMLYLQEHYKEQITLKSLANKLGYSYSYTSAIFKECFNKSFSDIVNEYRLEEATKLLKTKKYTITEVSQLCGFTTIRNFNIAFKKHFGKTPKEI